MDKQTLLHAAEALVVGTGFSVDREKEPWMPQRNGPDDLRSLMYHGWYKDVPATLKVSPYENYAEAEHGFGRYRRRKGPDPAVSIPEPMLYGSEFVNGAETHFLVQKAPKRGGKVLPRGPLASNEDQAFVAALYRNTAARFEPSGSSAEPFFSERFNRWKELGEKRGEPRKQYLEPGLRTEAFELVLREARGMRMMPFFTHFSNTDIVVSEGAYLIQDATIEERPEHYGAAFWVWGETMHAHEWAAAAWVAELTQWVRAFSFIPPRSFYALLLERFLGALAVDLPLLRSPFDALAEGDRSRAEYVLRASFKWALDMSKKQT